MPFTLAHPAAVMPLRRIRYLPTIALVVGSLLPDLPYYLPSRAHTEVWFDLHSLSGSVVVGIPLGMLVLAAVVLLRRQLTALLPERARWVAMREAEALVARPVSWLLAIPALLIGSWTHILWDGFTHSGTWIARRVDALNAPVELGDLYTGPLSHVLQYVSSIAGLLIIAYWYKLAVAEAPPDLDSPGNRSHRRRMLLAVTVAAIAIGTLHALHGVQYPAPRVYLLIYLLLTRTVAWFMLLYILAGTLEVRARRRQPLES